MRARARAREMELGRVALCCSPASTQGLPSVRHVWFYTRRRHGYSNRGNRVRAFLRSRSGARRGLQTPAHVADATLTSDVVVVREGLQS